MIVLLNKFEKNIFKFFINIVDVKFLIIYLIIGKLYLRYIKIFIKFMINIIIFIIDISILINCIIIWDNVFEDIILLIFFDCFSENIGINIIFFIIVI